jgi:Icc-related predicted phosphoesterase
MRIQLCSDLHLNFELHHRGTVFTPEPLAPVLVIAGDTWEAGKEFTHQTQWMARIADLFEHVVMVTGNHDYYGVDINKHDDKLRELAEKMGNVHFLQNDLVVIDGVKFAGGTLWTDFLRSGPHQYGPMRALEDFSRLADASHILDNGKLIHPRTILDKHLETVSFLEKVVDEQTVVVTHHCPSYQSCHPRWFSNQPTINHLFYSNLDWLIEQTKPLAWLHGHTHDCMDYALGKTRMACNPRGYVNSYSNENPQFDEVKVIEVSP